jgi:abortive infection bacteriophage resistance protein
LFRDSLYLELMHYTKRALTYDEQIKLLKQRGLELGDEARARRWLMRVGYYRLSVYFLPFKILNTDTYKPGATFERVTDLYKFDSGLRLLFMRAIDRVEVAVRALITYQLAHQLGPFGYADPANFAGSFDHAGFMRLLAHEEKRASELFINHYRGKYTSERYLPVWMMTELVSFGALSQLTENLRAKIRKRLAKEYILPEPVFISWIHTLTSVRNLCAHHNRLWNRILPVPPILPHEWTQDGITNDGVYCVALILRHMLSFASPRAQWVQRLRRLLDAHPDIDLNAMKFPANWKESWK